MSQYSLLLLRNMGKRAALNRGLCKMNAERAFQILVFRHKAAATNNTASSQHISTAKRVIGRNMALADTHKRTLTRIPMLG